MNSEILLFHQHAGQVDCNYCLEEKWFEIICQVRDGDKQQGWNVDS